MNSHAEAPWLTFIAQHLEAQRACCEMNAIMRRRVIDAKVRARTGTIEIADGQRIAIKRIAAADPHAADLVHIELTVLLIFRDPIADDAAPIRRISGGKAVGVAPD